MHEAHRSVEELAGGISRMSIKSILVVLWAAENTSAVADVAIALARRHEAYLVGLHVKAGHPRAHSLGFVSRATKLERMFRKRVEKLQLAHEWRCSSGDVERVLILASRCHDISIIGQADPNSTDL